MVPRLCPPCWALLIVSSQRERAGGKGRALSTWSSSPARVNTAHPRRSRPEAVRTKVSAHHPSRGGARLAGAMRTMLAGSDRSDGSVRSDGMGEDVAEAWGRWFDRLTMTLDARVVQPRTEQLRTVDAEGCVAKPATSVSAISRRDYAPLPKPQCAPIPGGAARCVQPCRR